MFEQAVLASQALRQATPPTVRRLMPALAGCPACRRVRLIAAPMLGLCDDCAVPLAFPTGSGSAARRQALAGEAA
jgi:hypothetical protein